MTNIKLIVKKILKGLARRVLKKYIPKVIVITGSVGKTLTKEAIYLVLSKNLFIRKSEKSFTNEVGVPLTIIGAPSGRGNFLRWLKNILFGLRLLFVRVPYPHWLILEVDNDKPGDLQNLASWLKPDILVMTAIGEVPTHIELFFSLEEFQKEKKYIVDSVKHKGLIIYNADDQILSNILDEADLRVVVSCGLEGDVTVKAEKVEILYGNGENSFIPTGMSFEVKHNSLNYKVNTLGSLGLPSVYASLLAFAVGVNFEINPLEIISLLSKLQPQPGRMRLISGLNDTTIIDDSYNSSPIALVQALDILSNLKTKGKKIAVIGDMMELGKYSATEHRKIAGLIKDKELFVVSVGFRARKICEELLSSGFKESSVLSINYTEDAAEDILKILSFGDVILIKGSQAMRMEKIVEKIMRHPEDRKKLLVRQEEEWLVK